MRRTGTLGSKFTPGPSPELVPGAQQKIIAAMTPQADVIVRNEQPGAKSGKVPHSRGKPPSGLH